MLILARLEGESLIISSDDWKPTDRVEVKILGFRGKQARIGIKAGKHVSVHRAEIQEKVDAEVEK